MSEADSSQVENLVVAHLCAQSCAKTLSQITPAIDLLSADYLLDVWRFVNELLLGLRYFEFPQSVRDDFAVPHTTPSVSVCGLPARSAHDAVSSVAVAGAGILLLTHVDLRRVELDIRQPGPLFPESWLINDLERKVALLPDLKESLGFLDVRDLLAASIELDREWEQAVEKISPDTIAALYAANESRCDTFLRMPEEEKDFFCEEAERQAQQVLIRNAQLSVPRFLFVCLRQLAEPFGTSVEPFYLGRQIIQWGPLRAQAEGSVEIPGGVSGLEKLCERVCREARKHPGSDVEVRCEYEIDMDEVSFRATLKKAIDRMGRDLVTAFVEGTGVSAPAVSTAAKPTSATAAGAQVNGSEEYIGPFTPKELRKIFGRSQPTLKRLLDSGAIRNKRLNSKTYLIHPRDLPVDWKTR